MTARILTQVLDLAGDLVLDLNPATGYRRVTLTAPGGQAWKFETEESPYVDGGTVRSTFSRPMGDRNELVRIHGDEALKATPDAYWMQVEDRLEALAAAVSQPFLWRIRDAGYVWTYRSIGPASVTPLGSKEDLVAFRRPAQMKFLVQPNPTKVAP